jgi:hypothetical protein
MSAFDVTVRPIDVQIALRNSDGSEEPNECMVTDMHVPRPISRDMHFCGIRCLAAWTKTKTTRATP